MSSRRKRVHDRAEGGYTLAEMTIVIAIVGILAMITVPNFTAMYRAGLLKNSMRQFATDLRGARARAASHNSDVRVTFDEGARPGFYWISEMRNDATEWKQVGNRRALQQRTYFKNVSFEDTVDDDGMPDIVFHRNGTADAPAGNGTVQIVLEDAADYDKNTYEISVRTTGKVETK